MYHFLNEEVCDKKKIIFKKFPTWKTKDETNRVRNLDIIELFFVLI